MTTAAFPTQKRDPVNYFGTELFLLKLFGYPLSDNQSKLYRIYSFLYFISSSLYVVLQFFELTKNDIDIVSEFLLYAIAETVALMKGVVLHKSGTNIRKLLDKIQREPFLPNLERGGNEEEKCLAKCLWLSNIQTKVYYGTTLFIPMCNIFYLVYIRLTSSDYHDWFFPYGPFAPLNVTYSPNYEIFCFYQNSSFIFFGFTFASTDLLLVSMLAHISCQFKILQNYLRHLVTISRNDMAKITTRGTCSKEDQINTFVSWDYLKKHLTKAVRYHVDIIDLANEAESLFSILLLYIFIGTQSMLCLSIYAASKATGPTETITYLFEAAVCCFQVLLICYWGEQLSNESDLVGQAAYETDFVGTDRRFQKALALIMRRALNTSKLTAGKFAVVSVVTFSWILRTAYSAFMVLRKDNIAEN